jgi:hypothetical protein
MFRPAQFGCLGSTTTGTLTRMSTWEIWPDNPEKAKIADLQNNAVGRRVGAGIAGSGLDPDAAMQKADIYVANMVRNHGPDLNFDF